VSDQRARREMVRNRDRIRGTIASQPFFLEFDDTGNQYPTLVADVDTGRNRLLRNVPIKLGTTSGGGRGYAKLGTPIWLERNGSRWTVVSQADRVMSKGEVTIVDETDGSETPAGETGFDYALQDYFYLKTVNSTTGDSYFNDNGSGDSEPWPPFLATDKDGNPV